MKKLPYIEDHIVAMGDHQLSWPPRDPLINLARYDVGVVDSMYTQVQSGTGFTDRQAILAHKIVCKYHRQWTAAGYDISEHIINARFRLPIRQVDRVKRIDIDQGRIRIRFPYDQEIISDIRSKISEIPGSLYFDKEQRCWTMALIEPRVIWAHEFGQQYGFEFDNEFVSTLESIRQYQGYSICLRPVESGFEIANAESSLVEYIQEHGGFGTDNLVRLLDLAGVLGYKIDPACYQRLSVPLTSITQSMLSGRDVNIEYGREGIDLEPVVQYATMSQRWPIYVYESGTSQLRRQLSRYFAESDIIDRKNNPTAAMSGSVVYFSHWRMADAHLPLLVTSHTLMIGSRRQQMLQCAEKIVYYTQKIEDEQLPISNT